MEYQYDSFNQLKNKVNEMKQRRDGINQDVMQRRTEESHIQEQMAQLQREQQRLRLEAESKDAQVKKYNDLIEQSEGALHKMMMNTQKLNDALSRALDDQLS